MIKKMLKILLLILMAIIAVALLYWLAERILSRISARVEPSSLPKSIAVYIMSNGVHTDIVLPVKNESKDWSALFPFHNTISQDTAFTFVGIGWGDKGFYLNTPEWKDLKASTAIVAATGLGETALHVSYYKRVQEDDLCYKWMIDTLQYRALVQYIEESLDRDNLGNAIYIDTDAQYNDADAFYEAKGAYNMFYSCNTWTNNALKQANMPAGVWATLDKGILSHYKTRAPADR
jgi:uncharacterized protein (TIGR02117 family)